MARYYRRCLTHILASSKTAPSFTDASDYRNHYRYLNLDSITNTNQVGERDNLVYRRVPSLLPFLIFGLLYRIEWMNGAWRCGAYRLGENPTESNRSQTAIIQQVPKVRTRQRRPLPLPLIMVTMPLSLVRSATSEHPSTLLTTLRYALTLYHRGSYGNPGCMNVYAAVIRVDGHRT